MRTVLITGGAGFIGSHLTTALSERGLEPIIFDHRRSRDLDSIDGDFFLGDIRDPGAVTEAMAHSDGWIHLAGVLGTQETIENPLPAAETNILGGLNILQAASQYGLPGVNIAVGNHWMENTYSISKATVERFARMYRRERGLDVSTMRAFNAYGPGQSIAAPFGDSKVRKIIPAMMCRAMAGQPIEIYGDGLQIMDMVHVRDVAEALADCLETTASGEMLASDYEVGSGRPTSVLEIAQMVAITVALETDLEPVDILHLPMRPGEPDRSTVLASDPWPIGYTTLEAGLLETYRWLESEWLPTWSD